MAFPPARPEPRARAQRTEAEPKRSVTCNSPRTAELVDACGASKEGSAGMRPSSKSVICVSLSLFATAACAKQPAPLTAPSGEKPSYAEQYPAHLSALRGRFAADEAKAQAALPQLEPAAQKLDKSAPGTLKQLFELADDEGK